LSLLGLPLGGVFVVPACLVQPVGVTSVALRLARTAGSPLYRAHAVLTSRVAPVPASPLPVHCRTIPNGSYGRTLPLSLSCNGDRSVVSGPVRRRPGSTALFPSPGCSVLCSLWERTVITGDTANPRLTRCSYQDSTGPPSGADGNPPTCVPDASTGLRLATPCPDAHLCTPVYTGSPS